MATPPRFDAVEAAFAEVAAAMPLALVVRHGGAVVLDLSGCRAADGRVFGSTDPVFLYSAVKPVAALTVLLAAADGHLDVDAPVAAVWPAFGAHGKDTVTVAQALAHAAAVPGWRDPISAAELADAAGAAERLAASPPWWPVGEPGEHAVSYGHVVDGILRHATGRDVVSWWDEVRAVGVTVDLLPGAREPFRLEDPGGVWRAEWFGQADGLGALVGNPPELLDVDWVNSPAGRALVAPAVTGYGSAHDLAHLWEWWVSDAARAHLGDVLHRRATTPEVVGHDHVLDRDVAWCLGPQLDEDGLGMGGMGCCVGWHDPVNGLSVGLTTPRPGPWERLDPLFGALDALAASGP